MKQDEKRQRIDFYKSAVIENYGSVTFTGDVAENIRKCQNHLNFSIKDYKGHINWYSGKREINRYHGNVCVVLYVPGKCFDIKIAGDIKPQLIQCKDKENKVKILFSTHNEDVDEAAIWTKTPFKMLLDYCK